MSITITPTIAWLLLLIAGLLEIVWSVSMKASNGFTRHVYTAITLMTAGISFGLLGAALKQLPVSTAYAVWTGIGAVGATIAGVLFFKEPITLARITCMAFIVTGIIGLKFLPNT